MMVVAVTLLFGVPWAALVLVPGWSTPVVAASSAVFLAGAVSLPWLMVLGHGRGSDAAARVGDTLLGVVWVLFAWSVIGFLVRLVLSALGLPEAARAVPIAVVVVTAVLVAWGVTEAMRVPRVRRVEVRLPRLGRGLDGVTVALLADTHFGPINRTRWSERTAAAVNRLEPDIVCHAGDIADGTVEQRREQAAPLGTIRARLARVCVTGNHEYFGEAQTWLDHLAELGWEPLHNRHLTVERGGDRLVVAGVDDAIAGASGLAGHGADHATALAGADPDLPVLLLAHQPRQVRQAVEAGIDLQVSGHTHGGQIWPFHYLVRVDQPTVHGLSRHGERTQLYTTRGAGFWGPPLRIFAPSEISLLTLRAGEA
ncbi:metallophosphoesterase [Actinophytocola xanthii]|uniref:Metallophosphoesterase n=1 Tax=Actinophytocola xanthii TaxID=1912961 RepID=A0A1Q8CS21_9PSEU|nr:metallophosphoesterase [Actinophytocola xanthii]